MMNISMSISADKSSSLLDTCRLNYKLLFKRYMSLYYLPTIKTSSFDIHLSHTQL